MRSKGHKSARTRQVAVTACHRGGEGDALPVGHQVVLAARLAAVRRVRAGRRAPLYIGTVVHYPLLCRDARTVHGGARPVALVLLWLRRSSRAEGRSLVAVLTNVDGWM